MIQDGTTNTDDDEVQSVISEKSKAKQHKKTPTKL
jgi:hypothetical protein